MSFLEGAVKDTLTVSGLVTEMTNACGDKAYSTNHMKKKIIEHFGNYVVISSVGGNNDIVSLKFNAAAIIHAFFENSQGQNDAEMKIKVLETAGKLLKADIYSMKAPKEYIQVSMKFFQQSLMSHFYQRVCNCL